MKTRGCSKEQYSLLQGAGCEAIGRSILAHVRDLERQNEILRKELEQERASRKEAGLAVRGPGQPSLRDEVLEEAATECYTVYARCQPWQDRELLEDAADAIRALKGRE